MEPMGYGIFLGPQLKNNTEIIQISMMSYFFNNQKIGKMAPTVSG
jgi:hypothetical protein